MTDYEKQVMRGAALDVYKATKILKEIDHNLGFTESCHAAVIEGCRNVLFAIAEEMYAQSAE